MVASQERDPARLHPLLAADELLVPYKGFGDSGVEQPSVHDTSAATACAMPGLQQAISFVEWRSKTKAVTCLQ